MPATTCRSTREHALCASAYPLSQACHCIAAALADAAPAAEIIESKATGDNATQLKDRLS